MSSQFRLFLVLTAAFLLGFFVGQEQDPLGRTPPLQNLFEAEYARGWREASRAYGRAHLKASQRRDSAEAPTPPSQQAASPTPRERRS